MPTSSTPLPLVAQIVPPTSGGVRDFAECLQADWARQGVASALIELGRPAARKHALHERLRALAAPGASSIAVLLHFSGYGYERRGLCWWLLDEVRSAQRRLGPQLRVVTMFHELFASGPAWRSAFWTRGVQSWIAREVACLSDAVWTNSRNHGDWLRRSIGNGVPLTVRPVFSTVGEPAVVRPPEQRSRDLVVFGSQSTRQRALDRLAANVGALRILGIAGITEAGAGHACAWPSPVIEQHYVGRLSEAEIESLLQDHRFALIDYPSVHLGKSTVFAAYVAHGCVVLNTAPPGADADGLQSGRHYVTLGRAAGAAGVAAGLKAHESIADAARAWYGDHMLSQQAGEFAALLHSGQPAPRAATRAPATETSLG